MFTINSNIKKEIVINKSKFITIIYYIENINEINDIIKNIKLEYNNATHYCYGYIIDGIKKCSDDGEPSGTAGLPILNVLESNNLNHILAVVVRYFGGVKLGANGLTKTYSNAVRDAIKECLIVNLINGYQYIITFTYENSKQIDYILKDQIIVSKNYDEYITYTINIDTKNIINDLKKITFNIEYKKNILIKK